MNRFLGWTGMRGPRTHLIVCWRRKAAFLTQTASTAKWIAALLTLIATQGFNFDETLITNNKTLPVAIAAARGIEPVHTFPE
jgi:hypothetical protein